MPKKYNNSQALFKKCIGTSASDAANTAEKHANKQSQIAKPSSPKK